MKIIINNETQLDDVTVMMRISQIIANGLISKSTHGECYCLVSSFEDCTVIADVTKTGTYIFNLVDY